MQSSGMCAPALLVVALIATSMLLTTGPESMIYAHGAKVPGSIESPNEASPIRLEIEPVNGSPYKRKGSIHLRISIKNISTEALLVCVDDWHAPTGLLSFDVYDADGKKVAVRDELHVDASISEDTHLKRLEPGDQRSGSMDLAAWGKQYDFKADTYFVVARYFCPFKGEKVIDGRSLRIATGKQVSLPRSITLTN